MPIRGRKLVESLGGKAAFIPLAKATDKTSVIAACGEAETTPLGLELDASVQKEGFQIVRKLNHIFVLGKDESGTMYGLLDVAEQARMQGGLNGVKEKISNPRFPFRAIKFNLPWSPYRPGAGRRYPLEDMPGSQVLATVSRYDGREQVQCPDPVESSSLHLHDPPDEFSEGLSPFR